MAKYQRVTWKPMFSVIVEGDVNEREAAMRFAEFFDNDIMGSGSYQIHKDLGHSLTVEPVSEADGNAAEWPELVHAEREAS